MSRYVYCPILRRQNKNFAHVCQLMRKLTTCKDIEDIGNNLEIEILFCVLYLLKLRLYIHQNVQSCRFADRMNALPLTLNNIELSTF